MLLIAITAALYSPVLGHQFIESWDDPPAILKNPDYNPPRLAKLGHYWVPPPKDTFYVPVTYTLWGLLAMAARGSAPPHVPFNPAVFYAANLAAHAISSGLVFLILRRLVRAPWAAWLAAMAFALHPVQVEGVATASSLYTPLSGLFGFLAIWQYLLFSGNRDTIASRGATPWAHYTLATLAFVLALLTKPTAVAVPLMIGVIEIVQRGHRPLAAVAALAPWVALALVVIGLNEHSSPAATIFLPEPLYRPLVPLDAIGWYVIKLLAPLRLASDYGRSPRWLVDHPAAWIVAAVPPVLGALAWRLRRRAAWAATSFGVFVAGLLPSIGIVPFDFQRYSTVADRYMYLAMLGPAIAVAFAIARLRPRAALIASSAPLVVLATLSIHQLRYWHDDWTLMAHTLDVNPDSASAAAGFKYLLTGWHDDQGYPAPRACPLGPAVLARVGDQMMRRRLWPVAAAAYRKALARAAPDTTLYDRLGTALLHDDQPTAAAEAFAGALRIDSANVAARQALSKLRPEVIAPQTTRPVPQAPRDAP